MKVTGMSYGYHSLCTIVIATLLWLVEKFLIVIKENI
jgi:hypothetical protein